MAPPTLNGVMGWVGRPHPRGRFVDALDQPGGLVSRGHWGILRVLRSGHAICEISPRCTCRRDR